MLSCQHRLSATSQGKFRDRPVHLRNLAGRKWGKFAYWAFVSLGRLAVLMLLPHGERDPESQCRAALNDIADLLGSPCRYFFVSCDPLGFRPAIVAKAKRNIPPWPPPWHSLGAAPLGGLPSPSIPIIRPALVRDVGRGPGIFGRGAVEVKLSALGSLLRSTTVGVVRYRRVTVYLAASYKYKHTARSTEEQVDVTP